MGIKMGIPKTVEVEAKLIRICVKVCDRFGGTLHDTNGAEIGSIAEGYVPDFFPGDHYGDYLILDIDVTTGQITNWKAPTGDQLREAFCKTEE